jgi:hypothetical protein
MSFWTVRPVYPRYLYFVAALLVFAIAVIDGLFKFLPEEPVSHYAVGFCVAVLICEVANLLKWFWLNYLW